MTKEEAKIIIGNIPIPIEDCYTITEYQEAKAEAIKALEQPTADVIERSEYIELLKENERLRGDLEFKSEAINSIGQIHKEYVSKIDKAIEEIIEYRNDSKNDFDPYEVGAINGALRILKRNIGDKKLPQTC